jgi:hypothetical protein
MSDDKIPMKQILDDLFGPGKRTVEGDSGGPYQGPTLTGLGRPSHALLSALRRVHDRSDRGELMALLCEAWGPSPAVKLCGARNGDSVCAKPAGHDQLHFDGSILDRGLGVFWGEPTVVSPMACEPSDLAGLAARESASLEHDPLLRFVGNALYAENKITEQEDALFETLLEERRGARPSFR